MDTKNNEKLVFVREHTLGSILSDVVTFGVIVASFWFNYRFIDGNNALDTLLFIVFFLQGFSNFKHYKRFYEEAQEAKTGRKCEDVHPDSDAKHKGGH